MLPSSPRSYYPLLQNRHWDRSCHSCRTLASIPPYMQRPPESASLSERLVVVCLWAASSPESGERRALLGNNQIPISLLCIPALCIRPARASAAWDRNKQPIQPWTRSSLLHRASHPREA